MNLVAKKAWACAIPLLRGAEGCVGVDSSGPGFPGNHDTPFKQ